MKIRSQFHPKITEPHLHTIVLVPMILNKLWFPSKYNGYNGGWRISIEEFEKSKYIYNVSKLVDWILYKWIGLYMRELKFNNFNLN